MTSMTRQHFKAIADAFRRTKPLDTGAGVAWGYSQWSKDVEAVAYALGQFNSQFDRDKFLAACGHCFIPGGSL